ncbi:hypothetical protein CMK12_14690 [Candidatus Poribacteria bacterium]|jgi:hypothetical protein|nr:hypothetical protein [Candidatus Poribacteria bacterium]
MWIRAGQFFAEDIVCPGLGSDWQAEYHKIAVDKSQNAGIYISTYLHIYAIQNRMTKLIAGLGEFARIL